MAKPLDDIRVALGNPKRKLGWFSQPPIAFPRPPWAGSVKDDPLMGVFDCFRRLYKVGVVVWGRVVMANARLSMPGEDDSVGEVLYSLSDPDEVALSELSRAAERLHELMDAEIPLPNWSQRERELAEDLVSGVSHHGGFRLPAEWLPHSREYRLSTVLFHRPHLPGGYLQGRLIPILVLPEIPYAAIVVPQAYWTPAVHEMVNAHQRKPAVDENSRKMREDAYQRVLGPIVSVFHEMEKRARHIDVYLFGPREPFQHYLYLSGGMSDAQQPPPADFARVELALYSTVRSPQLAEFVRQFAHYPWETGQSFGHGHTIPLGPYAEKVLGTSRFPFILLLAALRASDRELAGEVEIEGQPLSPLMAIPVTPAEFELITSAGVDEFLRRVAAASTSIIFDPERPSIV